MLFIIVLTNDKQCRHRGISSDILGSTSWDSNVSTGRPPGDAISIVSPTVTQILSTFTLTAGACNI